MLQEGLVASQEFLKPSKKHSGIDVSILGFFQLYKVTKMNAIFIVLI